MTQTVPAIECTADVPVPDECCVVPCDPAWRPDDYCIVTYENRFLRLPVVGDGDRPVAVAVLREYVEFRITYEHRLCLLGKQHGPLLYTLTLLPGETVKLYHSDRFRQITSTQQRYSVQTTFMQFLSVVHQARVSNSLDVLNEQLASGRSSSASSAGGGFFFGLFGGGGSGSDSSSSATSSATEVGIESAAEAFTQSTAQASQLTQAERSIVISTYEDRESLDVTVRTFANTNECRAVNYFVRQIMDVYAVSTRVAEISYRVVAPNVSPDWHAIDDLAGLPAAAQKQIKEDVKLLPKLSQVEARDRTISVPTEGVVYDPELAHCCSCEPERAAAIQLRLDQAKAEALKACLEVQELQLEVQRRQMRLANGELDPFEPTPLQPPLPASA